LRQPAPRPAGESAHDQWPVGTAVRHWGAEWWQPPHAVFHGGHRRRGARPVRAHTVRTRGRRGRRIVTKEVAGARRTAMACGVWGVVCIGVGGTPHEAVRAWQVEAGATIYHERCSPCHGVDGKATTPMA